MLDKLNTLDPRFPRNYSESNTLPGCYSSDDRTNVDGKAPASVCRESITSLVKKYPSAATDIWRTFLQIETFYEAQRQSCEKIVSAEMAQSMMYRKEVMLLKSENSGLRAALTMPERVTVPVSSDMTGGAAGSTDARRGNEVTKPESGTAKLGNTRNKESDPPKMSTAGRMKRVMERKIGPAANSGDLVPTHKETKLAHRLLKLTGAMNISPKDLAMALARSATEPCAQVKFDDVKGDAIKSEDGEEGAPVLEKGRARGLSIFGDLDEFFNVSLNNGESDEVDEVREADVTSVQLRQQHSPLHSPQDDVSDLLEKKKKGWRPSLLWKNLAAGKKHEDSTLVKKTPAIVHVPDYPWKKFAAHSEEREEAFRRKDLKYEIYDDDIY